MIIVQPLADGPAGEDGINPEARANLLSIATFSWMSALMKKVRCPPAALTLYEKLLQQTCLLLSRVYFGGRRMCGWCMAC